MTHFAPCDDWLNDSTKSNLIDGEKEKCFAREVSKVEKKYSRRRIFDKLLEGMELCINNHGDYFEYLIK